MDAQNVAESIASKLPPASSAPLNPSASSTTSDAAKSDKTKASSSTAPSMSKTVPASASTSTSAKPKEKEKDKDKDKDRDHKTSVATSHHHGHDEEDPAADNNSEAETIVLGKDASPSKSRQFPKRQVIKREDNSDDDRRSGTSDVPAKRKAHDPKAESSAVRESSQSLDASMHSKGTVKRKRLVDQPQSKDSSTLSSAPGTPLHHVRRRSADGRAESDLDSVHAKSAKLSHPSVKDTKEQDPKERHKDRDGHKVKTGGDRVVSQKRKVQRNDSDDESDLHKARRQRTSASIDASSSRPHPQKERDHSRFSASKSTHDALARHRSTSPHPRTHRRSASTQVVSQPSGLSHKKKRIPPPLSTDYQSDASSGSGSPHIRSSTARGLATPATAESMGSYSKNPAHKKHIDAHGQTPLAKACSKGELENVRKRLAERPEDLNFPDYAGNTPLQCAAINGYDDIVKLLIASRCDIECMNHDKDTPLLDAVENGHLEVVRLLLDAGVNPRKANVSGQEPLDLVTDDSEEAEAIRAALIEAKQKMADLRRASEDRDRHDDRDAQSSHDADSPHRRSPSFPEPSSSRRAASSRSHKMSNKVLYMPLDVKALREAAGKGDVETVERIMQIKDHDDPESMVAAARGGHDTVMQLLLAIGGANPDPPPVRSVKDEDYSTPILAAIGQENVEVIKLLLNQSNFDPTKRFKGETYFEIAKNRAGPSWKEEEVILREAYEEYRKSHRDHFKKSPNRKDVDSKRAGRTDARDDLTKSSKRKAVSPGREAPRVSTKAKVGDKEYKGTGLQAPRSDEATSPKRGPGRPKKDERGLPTIAISDGETSPRAPKSPKSKRADADAAVMSSEGEAKPRRRLMSRKEAIESREKDKVSRRASMVSTSSSLREPSSPRDPRHDEPPTEKYHDRAKALKRDESRDRLSVSGEHSSKRSRTSATPDLGASEKEGEPVKKRRLEVDKKDRVAKPSASPDRNRKSASSRDAPGSSKHDDKPARKHGDQTDKKEPSKPRKVDVVSEQAKRETGGKSSSSDKSIHVNVKSEDSDVVMRDAEPLHGDEIKARAKEDDKKRRAELEAKKKQKEKEKEVEERKQRAEEQRRQAEAKKLEEEEKEKRRVQEEERQRQEHEARLKREAEEAQRKAKEEQEMRMAEEAKIRREREEQERKKKEEEERVRKEKEAAEEARRKREEEERKEQERRAREELRLRRIREEQERKRLDKLPASLRWLDRSTNAKTPEMAFRWRMLRGVRFDSIRPETAGTSEGREQWVLNTQVAMLLGESDLQLTRFSGWDRVPASQPAKHLVMGLARPKPALLGQDDWDLGKQLPGYYFGKEPDQLSYQEKRQLEQESKVKFLALDLFFVKLSDLMFAVPNIPHLRSLEIVVTYHEVAETLEKHDDGDYPSRWKDDPDAARYMGYCPRNKYFINGLLVREGQVDVNSASYTPWPENRVPRYGLTAVPPTDPNYARLAKEQGLDHLLSGLRTPPMTIAAQTSPSRLYSQRAFDDLSPPQSESIATANGDGHHQPRSSTSSTAEQDRPLVNGNTAPFLVENGTDNNT